MSEPERFSFLGKLRPGPGYRVEGIPQSATLAGKRGLILRRREKHPGVVIVQWDDDEIPESVIISLLQEEGPLDQLARIYDGQ